jgi:multiple sugar transport system permease protein
MNKPAQFVGLQNYADLLADPAIWANFTTTAQYVIVSVGGQMVVGFGLALLLNRPFPSRAS